MNTLVGYGRGHMSKTLTFKVGRTISAPSDAIWQVLGDFGTEHRWTKTLDRCDRDTAIPQVGMVRTCTLPKPLMGRSFVREELTEYQPGSALAYRLEGSAGPFASAASRWSLYSGDDGGTHVRVEGFFTVASPLATILVWPIVKPILQRITRLVVDELAAFVTARQVAPPQSRAHTRGLSAPAWRPRPPR